MYRCITEIKGFLIDIDGFNEKLSEWEYFTQNYTCVFLTCDDETARMLSESYGDTSVFKIKGYERWNAPNSRVHAEVLRKMQIKATELVYISADLDFINNAMTFLGGTIWITQGINYRQTSTMPDRICKDVTTLKEYMRKGKSGFLGEMAVYPQQWNTGDAGMILPVEFNVDDQSIPLLALGRYFGYSHYMSQLHPYSSAIYLNKTGKAAGTYNKIFTTLYKLVINRLKEKHQIDGVCSVPAKPTEENRFASILQDIAQECGIENYSEKFISRRNFVPQKGLSDDKRRENVKDAFLYTGDLTGKSIVILDDVITTGATIKESIRELKRVGAEEVYVVVLAINQLAGSYWRSEWPQVSCPKCGGKMRLLINSNNGKFFYSCKTCPNTYVGFDRARDMFYDDTNNEFESEDF